MFMKHILTILLFLATTTAQANPVFENYIQWIVENSELEYNGEPLPSVVVVSNGYLKILAYGEITVAQSELNGTVLPDIVALYDHENNNIVVPDTLDLYDWNNHHVIVHELVHYLQDINGYYELPEYVECRVKLENLAYELHVAWMDEVDHPGERPNQLFLFMLLNSCRDTHY